MILLLAEMQDLKASKSAKTNAIIIESKLSSQKGALASVIVKSGRLKIGDFISVDGFGKLRAIINDKNERIKTLEPGDPGETWSSTSPSPVDFNHI